MEITESAQKKVLFEHNFTNLIFFTDKTVFPKSLIYIILRNDIFARIVFKNNK